MPRNTQQERMRYYKIINEQGARHQVELKRGECCPSYERPNHRVSGRAGQCDTPAWGRQIRSIVVNHFSLRDITARKIRGPRRGGVLCWVRVGDGGSGIAKCPSCGRHPTSLGEAVQVSLSVCLQAFRAIQTHRYLAACGHGYVH